MNRHGTLKDIRSKIKHENVNLGSGTATGTARPHNIPDHFNPSIPPRANVGAGPSFVSLAPSDSISNFEGNTHHASSESYRSPSPWNHSTASFALTTGAPSVNGPLRPARSVRRPQQAPGMDDSERSRTPTRSTLHIPPVPTGMTTSSPTRSGPSRDLLSRNQSTDRHARSAQLMAQVSHADSDLDGEEDMYGGLSPIHPQDEQTSFSSNSNSNRSSAPRGNHQKAIKRQSGDPLGSLTNSDEPAALGSVLSALSAAGRKHQAARIMRGTTAEEETRRRKTERKINETQGNSRRPIEDYVKSLDERGFREINATLRKVKAEWPFVADDDFNSVALALSMLDESSLGASRYDFEEMKGLIETSLQGTVDDHYESFATAITLHNSVLQSLTAAQGSVSGARRRLCDSREALGAKRADLVQMWQRSQAVKESLRLLDLVEHLKSVPDRLEHLMSEKRFLQAVNLLVRSLKTIDKPEIVEVGATTDLRAYLKGQEQAMLEILIEELHNHLYLKSYFCDVRWKSYNAGQEELPFIDFGTEYNMGVSEPQSNEEKKKTLKLNRYLQSLSARPTFDPNLASNIQDTGLSTSTSLSALTGEASKSAEVGQDDNQMSGIDVGGAEFEQNPEADSFLYIEMLLESLARLGKLGMALDTISQRLAIEVHQLVDATIDEVDARNEPLRRFSVAIRPESVLLASSSALAKSFSESIRASRTSFNMGNRPVSSIMRISAGESSALQRDSETMRDLFWTLFSKLDAVLQGHRVVYEVAGMIAGRAGFKDDLVAKKISGVGSLVEVWKPIQTEVRTLLHDYLMDDEQSSNSRNAIISVNDVLRDSRYGRDRSKQLFKLAETGKKGNGMLRRHEDALTAALRASVPGLVSTMEAVSASRTQVIVSSTRTEETYTGAGHRLLVKPDAFNVSVLFQPALAFIDRVQMVMPSEAAGETSKGFSAFLEEFVQDIFLPQLEDKVQSLFQSATGGSDAFQDDPLSRQTAQRPVAKSVSNIIVLIDSLYSMLMTTPFHRESYSRLIISTIVQYYQRCSERFRDLVAVEGGETYTLSSTWAQRPEIISCLAEMRECNDTERVRELQAQENRFQMALAQGVTQHDMTTSRKKLLALGSLQHSLQWLLSNVSRLKAADEAVPHSKTPQARLSVISIRQEENTDLKLPLSRDMAARYTALPGVYKHLSNVILFTLRHELRVRTIYHLNLATEGNYTISDSAIEPSPHIVDLNADLANLDDIFADALTSADKQFLFSGLASLMDTLLVQTAVRKLKSVNRQGVTKMIRNILALQQNLKNIVEPPTAVDFEKSRKFWELVAVGDVQSFLAGIKKTPTHLKQGFEEYKAALNLMLGIENGVATNPTNAVSTPTIGPTLAQTGAGTTADSGDISRQKFNEYLIELHEVAGANDEFD